MFAAVVFIPQGLISIGQTNTANMRAVDKRIIHTLTTDHTWLLPSPNRASFIQHFFGVCCTYHAVCVCVCVLSLCFLQSHSHSITQHCAKGYSSTKAFSFAITSSSLFSPLSVSASISLQHVCLFASLTSSVSLSLSPCPRYLLYQLTVILCVSVVSMPPCVWEQGQICASRSEVSFVAMCFNQLMDRAACLCWWRPQLPCWTCSHRRSSCQLDLFYLPGICITKGYPFWGTVLLKKKKNLFISHFTSSICVVCYLSFTSTICVFPLHCRRI